MSEIEDIIAVLNNLQYIEHVYYELQTLISKREYNITVDEKIIDNLKSRLKSYYAFIPYDISVIKYNNNYNIVKQKLEIYQLKIRRILAV